MSATSRSPQEGDTEDNSLIEPKTAQHLNYNPFKSQVGRYSKDAQLFPLELRPVLDEEEKQRSDFYNEMRLRKQQEQRRREEELMDRPRTIPERRHRVPRRPRGFDESYHSMDGSTCAQGTDVYRNILGPTPDESILAGLQTVIEICGLSDVCHVDTDSLNDSRPITESSRHSTLYSQDGASLRKSSSDTSQDEISCSSRPRYPPDLQWYPGGCRPIRRAIASSVPSGSPREPRDSLRRRSREHERHTPNVPPPSVRHSSPPSPLNRPCAMPPMAYPLPYPRIIGHSSSTSIHCGLPKCPVPMYQYRYDPRKEGSIPSSGHPTDLYQEYLTGQERLFPSIYGTARKGTVSSTSPHKDPADVITQEYQLALRDHSLFSIEDTDKSEGPAPQAVNYPIKSYDPTRKDVIHERPRIANTQPKYHDPSPQQNTRRIQHVPAVQERRRLCPCRTTYYDVIKKEQASVQEQAQQVQEQVAEKTTPVTHVELFSTCVTPPQQMHQINTTKHPSTEMTVAKYKTAQKGNVPAPCVSQDFQLIDDPQYPLIEISVTRCDTARTGSLPALVAGTKLEQAREIPMAVHTEQTVGRYALASKESIQGVQTSQTNPTGKEIQLVVKKSSIDRYDTFQKEKFSVKGNKAIEFHSAHQGFTAVKKDTKEKYQIAKRESLPQVYISTDFVPHGVVDYQTQQEGVTPVAKGVLGKHQVARKFSKSEISTLCDKCECALLQKQEDEPPSQKQQKVVSQPHKDIKKSESATNQEEIWCPYKQAAKCFEPDEKKRIPKVCHDQPQGYAKPPDLKDIKEDDGSVVIEECDPCTHPKCRTPYPVVVNSNDAIPDPQTHVETVPIVTENEKNKSVKTPKPASPVQIVKRELTPTASVAQMYQQPLEGYVVDSKDKTESYAFKQNYLKSLATVQPFENVNQAYVPQDSEPEKQYHLRQEAFRPPEEVERYDSSRPHQSKSKQILHSVPTILQQPYEVAEENEGVTDTFVEKIPSDTPPAIIVHQPSDESESSLDRGIKQAYRVSTKGHQRPLSIGQDFQMPKENIIVPDEAKKSKKTDAVKSMVLRQPPLLERQSFDTPEYSQISVRANIDKRMEMKHSAHPPPLTIRRPYEIPEIREVGQIEPSSPSKQLCSKPQQVEKTAISEGGIRKTDVIKCRKFIPREKSELGDVSRHGKRKREPLIKHLLKHPAETVESTSCLGNRVSCKDIHESIQTDFISLDRRIFEKDFCSDKCCGSSRDRIPCVKIKSTKDAGEGGICLKHVPDLTAQCFPPVNLPSGQELSGDCYKKNCVCPSSHCACSLCRCPAERRFFRKSCYS